MDTNFKQLDDTLDLLLDIQTLSIPNDKTFTKEELKEFTIKFSRQTTQLIKESIIKRV